MTRGRCDPLRSSTYGSFIHYSLPVFIGAFPDTLIKYLKSTFKNSLNKITNRQNNEINN
jgi:hypothetical protein